MSAMVLVSTKVKSPAVPRRALARPTVLARLQEAWEHRVTLLHAPAGYGKTTALAYLAAESDSVLWFTVEAEERDPYRWLAYLIEACRPVLHDMIDAPLALLDTSDRRPDHPTRILDLFINSCAEHLTAPCLLVIDDGHWVSAAPEVMALLERLIHYAPTTLRLLIATRYPLPFGQISRWRATGEVLELDRRVLAFQPAEIETLFRDTYGVALSSDEVEAVAILTEGWAIALHLVWQRIRRDPTLLRDLLLNQPRPALQTLFTYLAEDVYHQQPDEVRDFLVATAVLRTLTPAACRAVTERDDSDTLLRRVVNLDLFLTAIAQDTYRYHPLFHDFLRQQSPEKVYHQRAARYFVAQGDVPEGLFHFLAAGTWEEVAHLLEGQGEALLRAGQLERCAAALDQLPVLMVAQRSRLLTLWGDICRLTSRFEEALGWYDQAEQRARREQDTSGVVRALRGQALVYLDTVRPARAESVLEEAVRVGDGAADIEAQARVLELLAENKLNMGKPEEAERLRLSAHALRDEGPSEDTLSVRVKLRTGQLQEAQRILEQWVERERTAGHPYPPRAHRESVLLLSLICAFMGDVERARALAAEGVELGESLNSPFVSVVGHMRLGHAYQMTNTPNGYQSAIDSYHRAIAQGDELAVRRTRLEALWGLTRAYGFAGDLTAARRANAEGQEIGAWSGDGWVVALGDLALGTALVRLNLYNEAEPLLGKVLVAFRECGDRFGQAATHLWLALLYHAMGQLARRDAQLEPLLLLCEQGNYDFLLTIPTLLGLLDSRQIVPLLLATRKTQRWQGYSQRLLHTIGLTDIEAHPGYQLRVQTLGAFRVWRGTEEVEPRAWKRDKARQLFQLLLTERGKWLQREEITDRLWHDRTPTAALQDFKVALNALNHALEPNRAATAPFAYVERDGTAYRLRPTADMWCDADEIERVAALADKPPLSPALLNTIRAVVASYDGDYLPDALYEEWAMPRRDSLRTTFLRLATLLAHDAATNGNAADALTLCERLWEIDPCWEPAYQIAIHVYQMQGQSGLARRVYQRCAEVLETQLGVAPSFTPPA